MKKEKALSENVYKGRFYRVVDVAEAVKKLKEELCLGCKGKGCSNCERIDKIMGNFYSPQDERARSRKVDSTSKNVRYNASKPISNKRGGSFEDAHVQKDKGCVKK